MLLIHPFVQVICIGLALCALLWGVQRFRSLHLKHTVRFQWKYHVLAGKIAVGGLLVGAVIGMTMTRLAWGRSFMTMGHGVGGVVTISVLLLGAVCGWIMDKRRKKRVLLPAFHGLTNAVGLALALHQVSTGIEVYRTFLSGL
jgi:hypothetical protein